MSRVQYLHTSADTRWWCLIDRHRTVFTASGCHTAQMFRSCPSAVAIGVVVTPASCLTTIFFFSCEVCQSTCQVACLVVLWCMSAVNFAPQLMHVFVVRLRALKMRWPLRGSCGPCHCPPFFMLNLRPGMSRSRTVVITLVYGTLCCLFR